MKWGPINLSKYPLPSGNFLPRSEDVFKAFELIPFADVKVVILGQDPYPTKGHAHGLAFSVMPHVSPLPPSLRNILNEYSRDLGYPRPRNGCLSDWASRGVLLLNTILTVEEGRPLSHAGLGWEKLTYEVLKQLNEKRIHLVFLLWGRKAQEYTALLDQSRHLVLSASHPSPLAKGFSGCGHFTLVNKYLELNKIPPINWRLS